MAIVIDQFPKRESQLARPPNGYPTAFDRCSCAHIASQHGHADGWNLIGACLNIRCSCKAFEVASKRVDVAPTAVPVALAADETDQGGLFDLRPTAPPAVKKPRRGNAKATPDPKPTAQQAAVIDAFADGADLVIEAGAGAGKTSTLKMCANADKRRGVYIVFGKANAAEAKRKFPANVTPKTAHGFAFAAIGNRYAHRLFKAPYVPPQRSAEILGINESVSLARDLAPIPPRAIARIASGTVANYAKSADPEVAAHHVPKTPGLDLPAVHNALATVVVPYAAKAWGDLCSLDGKLRFTHDHYLKMWSLTAPQFEADYVLLDEAQDSDPVIAFIVNGQRNAQRILVGDENQAIFGWRGAINAMDGFAGRRLPLSQSFRFGPAVADEANLWLAALKSRLRLTGYGAISSRIGAVTAPDAILCRTNAATIAEASHEIKAGRKVALAGGTDAMQRMAEAALSLQQGRGTDHPDLLAFRTWEEVRAFVDHEDEGAELRTFVNLVESVGAEEILALLARTVTEKKADVVVSTAHKSKGLEWKTVRIADDFPEPKIPEPKPGQKPQKPKLPPALGMLAYVAVTRAQVVLDRGGLSWIDKW